LTRIHFQIWIFFSKVWNVFVISDYCWLISWFLVAWRQNTIKPSKFHLN
jgi:hypothetical protein